MKLHYSKELPKIAQFGVDVEQASALVQRVVRSVGASHDILVIACPFVENAYATETTGFLEDIPAGQHIIYNDQWLATVAGTDPYEVVVILAHEFGHFVNSHFSSRRSISSIQKELEADTFAGCAIANMGAHDLVLEGVLSRIRAKPSNNNSGYPDRESSITAAKTGYNDCARSVVGAHLEQAPSEPQTPASFSDQMILVLFIVVAPTIVLSFSFLLFRQNSERAWREKNLFKPAKFEKDFAQKRIEDIRVSSTTSNTNHDEFEARKFYEHLEKGDTIMYSSKENKSAASNFPLFLPILIMAISTLVVLYFVATSNRSDQQHPILKQIEDFSKALPASAE